MSQQQREMFLFSSQRIKKLFFFLRKRNQVCQTHLSWVKSTLKKHLLMWAVRGNKYIYEVLVQYMGSVAQLQLRTFTGSQVICLFSFNTSI